MASEDDRTYTDSPVANNLDKFPVPRDLQVTRQFEDIADRLKAPGKIILVRGIRGIGKSYLSRHLTHSKYMEMKKTASVIWTFEKMDVQEIENLEAELNKKAFLLEFRPSYDVSVAERFALLLKHLNDKKISSFFAFLCVSSQNQEEIRKIMDIILQLDAANASSQCIAVIQGEAALFTDRDVLKVYDKDIIEVELNGFTQQEAEKYLESHSRAEEGTDDLSSYLGGHPLFLKAAWEYCAEKKISYKQLVALIGGDAQKCYSRFLDLFNKNSDLFKKNLQSLEFLHNLLNGGIEGKLMEILETLCLIGTEDIPDRVVERICTQGPNWKEFYSRLHKVIPIMHNEHGNTITLPKFFACLILQGLKKNQDKVGNRLFRAMGVLTSLFSRDNRVWLDDGHLANTQKHIDMVMEHADQHFKMNFSMKKQVEEDFIIWMGMCKLQALLGQAYVQSRTAKNWKKALNILLHGAQRIWDVVDSYTKPGLPFLCFSNKSDPDILDFDESKNVSEVAKQIADKCLKAGKKIETAMVEQYLKSNIKISKAAFEDFVDNLAHSTHISMEEARNQLEGIWKSTSEGITLTEDQLKQLHDSDNLLPVESLKQVFLAERMCDFFHTYGRQDLYVWKEMRNTKDQLKKCKYYTEMSHYIAKRIREKTGIGLLYEFITTSNCMVPRSLQNRDKNETNPDRLTRLREAYTLANSLLADPVKYYENGMYMATQRSTYTKLNAQKYAVKAANKMVGINEDVPPDAIAICDSMLALAKDQIYLDMGPSCIIMAGKFYASVGEFKKSFEAFGNGFKTKKEGKSYGIFQHFEGRINTYAWAVANHARAIHAAIKKNEQVDEEMKRKVILQCITIFKSKDPDLKEEWKHQMKGWEQLLSRDA